MHTTIDNGWVYWKKGLVMKINLWVLGVGVLLVGLPVQAEKDCNEMEEAPALFSYSATTTWKDFTLAPIINQYCPKRWVWTGMIVLKSTQPVNLQELCLQWRGEKIGTLQASLYQKKETDRKLIPIQENLVCDGQWNSNKQALTFFLDKKIVAVNKYYLFLNFSEKDSCKVKKGTFIIPNKDSLKITYLH